jgi:hypothetical protein
MTREQGTGNREQGTGNREQGTGNREQGTGNREQGTGNREQGTGKLYFSLLVSVFPFNYLYIPILNHNGEAGSSSKSSNPLNACKINILACHLTRELRCQ